MTIIALFFIKLYKRLLSPILPSSCRFHPTCSEYAIEALEIHGFFHGSWLSMKRIARCNPYCSCGYDPVPQKKSESNSKITKINIGKS